MTCGPVSTHLPFAGFSPHGSMLLASLPPWSMYIRPTLLAGGGLCAIHASAHFMPLASMHIGSFPGVCGLSGMQVQPLVPWRTVVTAPLASIVMIAASCAIDAGAADCALATGSFEAAVWICPVDASALLPATPVLLQAPTLASAPASSNVRRKDVKIMKPSYPSPEEGRAI